MSVVVASANRDEDHYEHPDVFDLDRRADDHLAFGFGRHHCLGLPPRTPRGARWRSTRCSIGCPNLRLDPSAPRAHDHRAGVPLAEDAAGAGELSRDAQPARAIAPPLAPGAADR